MEASTFPAALRTLIHSYLEPVALELQSLRPWGESPFTSSVAEFGLVEKERGSTKGEKKKKRGKSSREGKTWKERGRRKTLPPWRFTSGVRCLHHGERGGRVSRRPSAPENL